MDSEKKVRSERAKRLRRKKIKKWIIIIVIVALLIAGWRIYAYKIAKGL